MRHEWTPRTQDAALAADDLEGGRRGFWIQTVTGTFMTLDGPFGSEIAAEMLRVESERRALAERVRDLEQLSASRLDLANKATDEAAKAQERAAQAEEANQRLTARVGELEAQALAQFAHETEQGEELAYYEVRESERAAAYAAVEAENRRLVGERKELALACRGCGQMLKPKGEVTVSPEFGMTVIYVAPGHVCD